MWPKLQDLKEFLIRFLLCVCCLVGIYLFLCLCEYCFQYMGASSSSNMSVSAATKKTATIIFLHGLGDTGDGWYQALCSLKLSHLKLICPTAPQQPVTLNGGMWMNSWFDLKSLDISGIEDEEGIKKATEIVHKLIEEEEHNGTNSKRIILGGFSQGGALALYSALRFQRPLAGVVALSSWIPLHKSFPQAALGNLETPVFQCHGDDDDIVPFQWGKMSNVMLKSFMKNVQFKSYAKLTHSSCPEEMRDVESFILELLPPL